MTGSSALCSAFATITGYDEGRFESLHRELQAVGLPPAGERGLRLADAAMLLLATLGADAAREGLPAVRAFALMTRRLHDLPGRTYGAATDVLQRLDNAGTFAEAVAEAIGSAFDLVAMLTRWAEGPSPMRHRRKRWQCFMPRTSLPV